MLSLLVSSCFLSGARLRGGAGFGPGTGFRGLEHRVADSLGFEAVAEVGAHALTALDCADEVGEGVQERVLVADGGTGYPVMTHPGGLGVGHVDLAPAREMRLSLLPGLELLVLEVLEMLGVFEVEADAAVGSVQLEGV